MKPLKQALSTNKESVKWQFLTMLSGFIMAIVAVGTIPGYVDPINDPETGKLILEGHWMPKPQVAFRWIGVAGVTLTSWMAPRVAAR